METLRDVHGAEVAIGAMRVLGLRCASRPACKDIVQSISELRVRVRDAKEAADEARDRRIAASAEIVYRDSVLDAAVMTLSRQAMALVDGDTKDVRYKMLFPSPPSAKLRPVGGSAQATYVQGVLKALDEEEGLIELQAYKTPIEDALSELQIATQRRDALKVEENRSNTALQVELGEARAAYNQAYHQLSVMFPRDKALVESFFPAVSSRDRKNNTQGGDEPVPPVA